MAFTLRLFRTPTDALGPHRQADVESTGKHHNAYVTNRTRRSSIGLQSKSIEDLLRINTVPEHPHRGANNGGGHANHAMCGQVMAPKGGGAPSGAIADAINSSFGNFDALKDAVKKAGVGRFGSGWAWVISQGNKLVVESSANQDSPLMEGKTIVFGVDVWEHAYYLKYQNRRPDYLAAWWNVINWAEVNKRLKG